MQDEEALLIHQTTIFFVRLLYLFIKNVPPYLEETTLGGVCLRFRAGKELSSAIRAFFSNGPVNGRKSTMTLWRILVDYLLLRLVAKSCVIYIRCGGCSSLRR
jgi:hypothetical protein